VATGATAEKEVADAATAKKAANDAVAMKKAANDAAAAKKAANDAAAMKKAMDDVAAVKKVVDDAVIAGSDSSSAQSAGAKRVPTPSGSTPPAKRQFLSSWKPRYVTQTFICHFLYCICDFDLVLLVYSVSSSGRSPPSRGGGDLA
jgi:membrane protein involved in colicin uptake